MLIPLTDILSKYKITCSSIAHFGAHHGQEVDSYLKNNFTEIHLFEPQSSCFSVLKKKFAQNKAITLHNFALGSHTETSVLNLGSGDGQASSILKPGLHAELYPYIEFTESENIEIKRSIEKINSELEVGKRISKIYLFNEEFPKIHSDYTRLINCNIIYYNGYSNYK